MTLRVIAWLGVALFFSGCAGKAGFDNFRVSLGIITPYEAALDAFKRGEVMEARVRLVSIKKGDKYYTRARKLLNNKVEPARLKLLRYFARKGKSEEKLERWAQAEEAYKTATGLSRSPKALLRYQQEMNIKARQLRAKTLYVLHLDEDESWLKWQDNYNPPHGLFGDDKSFELARDEHIKALDEHADAIWSLARKHEALDMPEIAWVYADSYLRFKPYSKKAQDLKHAMATAVPQSFGLDKIVNLKKPTSIKLAKKHSARSVKATKVTKVEVKKLMKKGLWGQAKKAAQSLRRQGNSDADVLLVNIGKRAASLAAKAYEEGNISFRRENIDAAVVSWGKAVKWMPKEQIYMDSLRRGKKIQERLAALKREESPAEKDSKIEE